MKIDLIEKNRDFLKKVCKRAQRVLFMRIPTDIINPLAKSDKRGIRTKYRENEPKNIGLIGDNRSSEQS